MAWKSQRQSREWAHSRSHWKEWTRSKEWNTQHNNTTTAQQNTCIHFVCRYAPSHCLCCGVILRLCLCIGVLGVCLSVFIAVGFIWIRQRQCYNQIDRVYSFWAQLSCVWLFFYSFHTQIHQLSICAKWNYEVAPIIFFHFLFILRFRLVVCFCRWSLFVSFIFGMQQCLACIFFVRHQLHFTNKPLPHFNTGLYYTRIVIIQRVKCNSHCGRNVVYKIHIHVWPYTIFWVYFNSTSIKLGINASALFFLPYMKQIKEKKQQQHVVHELYALC